MLCRLQVAIDGVTILDDTVGLARSGVVEIRPPSDWQKATLSGLEQTESLLWLRLRLVYGTFESRPLLSSIRLNMVTAKATRTVRNEVLIPKTEGDGQYAMLEHRPVMPGTLVLKVQEGSETHTWHQVDNLTERDADARVYELDESTAKLRFGDGVNGAELPKGFRHVVAERYLIGSGTEGAVDKDQITILLSSAPFVTGISNPRAASGGTDAESSIQTRMRGPEEIRARGRAVTTQDYNLLAKRAPGAEVERAHAVSRPASGPVVRSSPGVLHLGRWQADTPAFQRPCLADLRLERSAASPLRGLHHRVFRLPPTRPALRHLRRGRALVLVRV